MQPETIQPQPQPGSVPPNAVPSGYQASPQAPQVIAPTNTVVQPTVSPSPSQAAPQPQVMSPAPQAQPAMVMGQVAPQSYEQPQQTNKLKPLLMGVGALAAVAIVGIVLFSVVLKHPITFKELTQAQTTADSFDNDVYQATSAINSAQDANTTDALNSGISQANAKLSDAQKQFTLLKKSNVQSNGDVKKTFNALSAKWTPYQTFLQSSVKDTQALAPVFIQFGNATQSFSNNEPSDSAALASYLGSFKQTLDSTSQQASGIKLTLPEDKELLSAFQTDLQSSSQAVAKAQSDLSAGSDVFTVEDDILNVEDAQTTFETAANKVNDELNTKQGQLDPGTAYNNFLSALNKLSTTVKS